MTRNKSARGQKCWCERHAQRIQGRSEINSSEPTKFVFQKGCPFQNENSTSSDLSLPLVEVTLRATDMPVFGLIASPALASIAFAFVSAFIFLAINLIEKTTSRGLKPLLGPRGALLTLKLYDGS